MGRMGWLIDAAIARGGCGVARLAPNCLLRRLRRAWWGLLGGRLRRRRWRVVRASPRGGLVWLGGEKVKEDDCLRLRLPILRGRCGGLSPRRHHRVRCGRSRGCVLRLTENHGLSAPFRRASTRLRRAG